MIKKYLTKKYIFPALVVLLVIALALLPFIIESARNDNASEASILSAKAEITDISRTVSGTGTLTPEEGTDIELPSGVEVTRYLVSNGDFVTEGTPLANVDKTSVLTAISEVQDSLEAVEEDMVDCAEDTADDKIYTGAPGIIKAIYASEGDDVKSIMAEHGCLARVSLDGCMAVNVSAEGLKVGDKVEVTLSDGTVLPGKVDTSAGGIAVITVTDKGTTYGDIVTVSMNGKTLGDGELYIHSEFKATAYTGTVSHVYFNVEESVLSGAALFYLQDVENSAQYEIYAAQHREYEDIMERLFKMLNDGYISAPCDGCISGIDEDEAKELEKEAKTIRANAAAFTSQIDQVWANAYNNLISAGYQLKTELNAKETEYNKKVKSYTAMVTNASSKTVSGKLPNKDTGVEDFFLNNYTIPEEYWSETFTDGTVLSITVDLNKTPPEITSVKASGGGGDVKKDTKDDTTTNNTSTVTGTSDSNFYSTYEDVIMTVTPQNDMTITITIDELDILKLSVGQEALVTIDALPGTSFTGTVTSISKTAANSGGNSKFTAEVTLKREEKMLDGMNATALITVQEYPGILGIPVSALYEDGTKTTVYTSYDKKHETLGNPVEVETGVSDGETVEILSGISEGTQVWYEYYDKVEISFNP